MEAENCSEAEQQEVGSPMLRPCSTVLCQCSQCMDCWTHDDINFKTLHYGTGCVLQRSSKRKERVKESKEVKKGGGSLPPFFKLMIMLHF